MQQTIENHFLFFGKLFYELYRHNLFVNKMFYSQTLESLFSFNCRWCVFVSHRFAVAVPLWFMSARMSISFTMNFSQNQHQNQSRWYTGSNSCFLRFNLLMALIACYKIVSILRLTVECFHFCGCVSRMLYGTVIILK